MSSVETGVSSGSGCGGSLGGGDGFVAVLVGSDLGLRVLVFGTVPDRRGSGRGAVLVGGVSTGVVLTGGVSTGGVATGCLTTGGSC